MNFAGVVGGKRVKSLTCSTICYRNFLIKKLVDILTIECETNAKIF